MKFDEQKQNYGAGGEAKNNSSDDFDLEHELRMRSIFGDEYDFLKEKSPKHENENPENSEQEMNQSEAGNNAVRSMKERIYRDTVGRDADSAKHIKREPASKHTGHSVKHSEPNFEYMDELMAEHEKQIKKPVEVRVDLPDDEFMYEKTWLAEDIPAPEKSETVKPENTVQRSEIKNTGKFTQKKVPEEAVKSAEKDASGKTGKTVEKGESKKTEKSVKKDVPNKAEKSVKKDVPKKKENTAEKEATPKAEKPAKKKAVKTEEPVSEAKKPEKGKKEISEEKSALKKTKKAAEKEFADNPENPVNIPQPENSGSNGKDRKIGKVIGKTIGRIMLVLLETLLLVVVALYGVMYILAKGPSDTARELFVMSVRETSAVGFLANLYLSDEEIAQIEANRFNNEYEETDTSLIDINAVKEEGDSPKADKWGLIDDDGDGIIVDRITGEGYNGYMMVVLDPSRVIMGSKPESFCVRGYTVAEMVQEFGAVAGINAGGFYDPSGQGDGSVPDSLVVVDGEIYCDEYGTSHGFVGIDENYIMHVGNMSVEDVRSIDGIKWGVCFGPVLVQNGEGVDPDTLASGINPRTAIGQRSDGAILLLVIDGRQVISLGATYRDCMDIMLRYGAVNACNLDGGSSSLMWFGGDYINNCASVIGIRPVPSTFLVLPEGAKDNG